MRSTRRSAFTLTELITAVLIVALLSGMAVVSLRAPVTRAQDEAARAQVSSLLMAADLYRALRNDRDPAYDPADPLLTTTYYDAAEQLNAFRKPEVVQASTSTGEVSFGLSDNRRLLGASVMSESGICVHGVRTPDHQPVVTVGPDMHTCSAFAQGWDAQIAPDVLAALLGQDTVAAPAWLSTDSEPHRAPDGSIINRAPFAEDDAATTAEDEQVAIDVLANDIDFDGDLLSVADITEPANGAVAIDGSGRIVYAPAADFHGVDTFSYSLSDGRGGSFVAVVQVTVTPVNDAPQAGDDHATTDEDTAVDVDVTEDDVDVDGDDLAVAIVQAPSSGAAEVLADGTVRYTPDANFNGTDELTYAVTDPTGAADTAVLTIVVTDANDAPVAADDAVVTTEDGPVTIDLLANDSDVDGDELAVAAVDQPRNGTVVVDAQGEVTYFPAADFAGDDSFTYDVTDGNGGQDTAVVAVTVTAVNDAPVARDDAASVVQDRPVTVVVRDNDSDVDGDTLSVASVDGVAGGTAEVTNGAVTFRPALGFTGTAGFTYTLADPSGATDQAYVTVEVVPSDDTIVICHRTDPADEGSDLVVDRAAGQDEVESGPSTYGLCSHPEDHDPEDDGETKVTICHQPGTPAEKTLQVPESALRGHYRHGDYDGPCV